MNDRQVEALADEIKHYRLMGDYAVYSGPQVANILQMWADRTPSAPDVASNSLLLRHWKNAEMEISRLKDENFQLRRKINTPKHMRGADR